MFRVWGLGFLANVQAVEADLQRRVTLPDFALRKLLR